MHIAIITFKCLHNNVSGLLQYYITFINARRVTRNVECKCFIPKVNLVTDSKGFYVRGPQVYNSLPVDIQKQKSLVRFKKKVLEFFID